MANDDFLVPSDVDLSTNCAIDQDVLHKGTILRSFACLSIACYLYLFWMYFVVKTPVLKRHPTRLAIYGCIIEMGYFQQYLWLPTIGKDYLYSDDVMVEPYFCNSSIAASRWAFVTQFCMIGVQLCFLIISVDLRLAYTNPFSSYKHNKLYFASFVILGSLFTALCLLAMGPRVYGYDEHGIIWIQDSRAPLAMNWPKFMLYYLIVSCIYTYSLWANFQFYRSSEKGLSVTISNRLSIMLRSKRFVLGHIAVDAFILALEFLSFLSDKEQQLLLALPSYLQALRGVLGMAVILYSNGKDITWQGMNPFYFPSSATDKNMVEKVALEGLLQQPHLNTALRAEILYFSTQGIMFAARSHAAHAGLEEGDEGLDYGDEESGKRVSGAGAEANMYGFESHPTLGIRASLVDDGMRTGGGVGASNRGPVKPIGASAAATAAASSSSGAHATGVGRASDSRPSEKAAADLAAILKTQDERALADREKAFLEQVESLGCTKDSFSFRGVDQRLNSSSSASSPYTFHMARPPHVPTLLAANTALNARSSLSHSQAPRADTRNPMAARESELEMRSTTGANNPVSRHESADSQGTGGSSVATVKWRETMDVEFSMGRTDNGSSTAVDGWYRVPSPPRQKKKPGEEDDFSSVASSDATGSSHRSSSLPVTLMRRTLQTALSSAQSIFNPAFKEFRFKDFSPGYFAKVRETCNLSPEEYSRSFEATCKETFSEGRSGAFMFFSSDQRCIAKSTSKAELLSLQKLMPHYVEYLTTHPNSLITRFIGAHCITMYGVELYFIVMLNCFPPHRLSERYDLKGSWVNRHALTKTQFSGAGGTKRKEVVKSPLLYLDNDLQHKLSLQPGVAQQIAEQIFKDVEFLTQHKKMDYSLLIGVKRERFEVMSGLPQSGSGEGPTDEFRATISTKNGRLTDHVPLGQSISAYRSGTVPAGGAPTTPGKSGSSGTTLRVMSRAEDDQADPEEDGGLHTRFVEGPAKYYMGIIDVLQEWTLKKQLERAIKVYLYRADAYGLSAMNPTDYSKRFLQRCVLETFEGLEETRPTCASGQTQTTADSAMADSAAGTYGSAMGTY